MRSRNDYILTKDEVYGYANCWLESALRLEYEGTKCSGNMVIAVLLIAAARVVSILAACRWCGTELEAVREKMARARLAD